jgi:hypothetical protein
MAANSEEITLETKRCIFVADHIYFSNYYLKSKITKATGQVNKIKFDDTEFMNKTMIQDENKKKVSNQPEITGSPLPNLSNLNESLYSKVNISNNTIDINVAENDILQLKIEDKTIFKDNEQIKQFLKYDGWWCPEAQQINFDERVKPAPTDLVPSELSQAGATVSQPSAQQSNVGGSKQTRSTRNHKNRKSKKN